LDPACKEPYKMLDEWKPFLDEISFGTLAQEKDLDNEFFSFGDDVSDDTPEEYTNFEDIMGDLE